MALLKINSDKNFTPTKKEDNTSLISTIELGLREAKTTDNKFGWSIVDKMPYDEPCVLYLGGNKEADSKLSSMWKKMIANGKALRNEVFQHFMVQRRARGK